MNGQAKPNPSRLSDVEVGHASRETTSSEHAVSQRHRVNRRSDDAARHQSIANRTERTLRDEDWDPTNLGQAASLESTESTYGYAPSSRGAIAHSGEHELRLPLRAQSEPPPCDRTLAYDRAELSRLLEATERSSVDASAVPENATTRLANTAETVRPPTSVRRGEPTATASRASREAPSPMLARDNEEPTRAYQRDRLSAPHDEIADHPSRRSDPNTPTRPAPGIRAGSPELELSRIPRLRDAMTLAISVDEPQISEIDAPATQPAGTLPPTRTRSRFAPILVLSGLVGLFAAGTALPAPTLQAFKTTVARAVTMATSTARGHVGASTTVASSERLVEIDLSILPLDAKVTLDGRPISNPLRIAYPFSNKKHELRAEAPQHESRILQLTFERDIQIELSLPPLAASKVSPNPTAKSTPLP
ncbi:MAG: hypothetical protein QM784_01980 [Polyangiaceae bacterium]